MAFPKQVFELPLNMSLLNGELIDMVSLDSEFGQTVARDYTPFYKRKKFGLL